MNFRGDLRVRARRVGDALNRWYRSGPSRLRLRRRLYLATAPLAIVALLAAAKLVTVTVVGRSAVSAFARHDIETLREDVSILSSFDIIEPQRLPFIEGDLRALEGRLADADERFTVALSRTRGPDACAVRVNLELIRETRGDLAARDRDVQAAEQQYRGALDVIEHAAAGCFEGNLDPNGDRRTIREEAAARVNEKIEILHRPPPPPPSPPPPVEVPPPPTSLEPAPPGPPLPNLDEPTTTAPRPPPQLNPDATNLVPGPDDEGSGTSNGNSPMNDVDADRLPIANDNATRRPGHRAQPGNGDPLERLHQLLRDSDSYGSNNE